MDVLALEELEEASHKNSNGNGDRMAVDGESDSELEDEEDSGVSDSDSSEKAEERKRWRDDSQTSLDEEEPSSPSSDDDSSPETNLPKKGKGRLKKAPQTERIITPKEVRAHLRLLFQNEEDIATLLYSPHGPLSTSTSTKATPDIFFTEVVSVPPSRFRPAATMGDQVFENPQNSLLNLVLRQTFLVRDLSESLRNAGKVVER